MKRLKTQGFNLSFKLFMNDTENDTLHNSYNTQLLQLLLKAYSLERNVHRVVKLLRLSGK